MGLMRISQLAERTGVPAATLRFYESAGLLPAGRTPSGYRAYKDDAVERLAFTGGAEQLGMPLEEIAGLLAVWESKSGAEVKAGLRPRVATRLAKAEQRVADLKALTTLLHSALEHLNALLERAARCTLECAVLASPGSGTFGHGPAFPSKSPRLIRLTRWSQASHLTHFCAPQ
ncbi:MerR family transcriptional regulator [Streptomyces sp. NPDC101227]|uniref:MerR family transcriptional regulator n=1 Tax=Streptomyces sp. NPDC101227 TaxID=3366136 RepID=UPI0037F5BC97